VDWVTPAQQAKRAQHVVFQLMAVNCLPGFLASHQWKNFRLLLQAPGGDALLPPEAQAALAQLLQKRVATAETLRGLLITENKWFQRFVRIAERLPCSLSIADMHLPQQPIIYVNREYEMMTGYKREQIIGQNGRLLQGPRTRREIVKYMSTEIKNQRSVQVRILNYRANGEEFMNFLSLKPVFEVDPIDSARMDIESKKAAESIARSASDPRHGSRSSSDLLEVGSEVPMGAAMGVAPAAPGAEKKAAPAAAPAAAAPVASSLKQKSESAESIDEEDSESRVERRSIRYYIGLQFDVSTTGMPGMLYVDAIFRLLPDRV
jgi:PAS domain S-box-containing protein